MTNLRTATYRKPRVIRTVTLEAQSSSGWTGYVILVCKGTGRTCWAGNASTLTEAVAEFHRAIEWVVSEGLEISAETLEEDHTLALAENDRRETQARRWAAAEAAVDAKPEPTTTTECETCGATVRASRMDVHALEECGPAAHLPAGCPGGQWCRCPKSEPCYPASPSVQALEEFKARLDQEELDTQHTLALLEDLERTATANGWELDDRTELAGGTVAFTWTRDGKTAVALVRPEGVVRGGTGTYSRETAWRWMTRRVWNLAGLVSILKADRRPLAAPAAPSVQAHFGGWTSGAMATVPPEGTESVPPGGFPSPFAVAFLSALTQGSGRWVPSRGELAEAEELEGRGFVVKIPGLKVRVLTESGREFARRWILSGV